MGESLCQAERQRTSVASDIDDDLIFLDSFPINGCSARVNNGEYRVDDTDTCRL